jgi:hypothetical protein
MDYHFYPSPMHNPALPFEGSAMELFRAEKIATVVDQATKTCRFCDEKLRHVRAVVISDTGAVIHMFECRCGERIWTD